MSEDDLLSILSNMLELDLDNLDMHVRRTPGVLYKLGQMASDAWEESYLAKRAIKQAEAKAWARAINTSVKGKMPTQKQADIMVEMDEGVQAAHLTYAKAEGRRREMESLIDALQRKSSYMPGLQGKQNLLVKGM